ncbi:MAG: hypothetical protein KAI66_24115 [Lentisphaeria bacterium]|nr:hypothetical protein [Lentisphaeria bacterium]
MKTHSVLLCNLAIAATTKAADLPPEMVAAAPVPRAMMTTLEDPWKPAQRTIALPIGDTPQSVTLTFPGHKTAKDKLLLLRFRSRIAWSVPAGWNHYLQIRINGQPLGPETKDDMYRLLNRRETFVRTSNPSCPKDSYFRKTFGPSALLTPFGPDWESIEPAFVSDRTELYWHVIDITDLARQQGENVIVFTNLARAEFFKKTPDQLRDNSLLIDSLEIGTAPERVRGTLARDVDAEFDIFHAAASVENGGIQVAAASEGAIRVHANGDSYLLNSSFTAEGHPIKYHSFHSVPDESWDVSASKRADALTVVGVAEMYTVTRSVRLDGSFIRIDDTIKNTSGKDIGLIITHNILADSPADTWRLAGIKDVPTTDRPSYNPTIYAELQHSGLGAAVKDSPFRAEMSVSASFKRIFTMSNEHFGLSAGTSYTIRWSLRVGGPDFWEFINAVRRDWGVNHTIPGMYSFFYTNTDGITPPGLLENPDKLRAYLERIHIDVFAVDPWFNWFFSKSRNWKTPFKHFKHPKQFKKEVQRSAMSLRAVQPEARVIGCLESFLCYKSVDFFKGTLPKFWTDARGARGNLSRSSAPHSYSLSPAGTRVVDASPWGDSVFRDENGAVDVDLHYTWCYEDDSDGGANLKVFPTLDNYWQKRFMEIIDFCLDECGLDGVYVDSFNYYNQRSYGMWDGHSVDIDPTTGAIKRKYANLTLLTAKARREWVKACTDKGKLFFANGKPATEELQNLPFISFMEAEWGFTQDGEQSDAPGAAQAMLSSPLALGIRPSLHVKDPSDYAETLQRAVISYLRYGTLYCYYSANIVPENGPGGHGVLNHMYPFTPIELHEGWIVGKERIITAVSGNYAWPHKDKPSCLRFDTRGMPKAGGFTLTQKHDGWNVNFSLDDWSETAVILFPEER